MPNIQPTRSINFPEIEFDVVVCLALCEATGIDRVDALAAQFNAKVTMEFDRLGSLALIYDGNTVGHFIKSPGGGWAFTCPRR